MKCEDCKYRGNCLYENAEFAGLKANECCEMWYVEDNGLEMQP